MAAHLSYGRVNLNVLREAVRRELREFLDKCAGSKVRDRRDRRQRHRPRSGLGGPRTSAAKGTPAASPRPEAGGGDGGSAWATSRPPRFL